MPLPRDIVLRRPYVCLPQLAARSRRSFQYHRIGARQRKIDSQIRRENKEDDDDDALPPVDVAEGCSSDDSDSEKDERVGEGGQWLHTAQTGYGDEAAERTQSATATKTLVRKPDMTPRTVFNQRLEDKNRLTLDLIMSLDQQSISQIRDHFLSCENASMTLPEFIEVVQEHIGENQHFAKHEVVASLSDLFKSMDLDGNMDLHFSEFLATILHVGMSSSSSYGIETIRFYYDGPRIQFSLQPTERFVQYIEAIDRLLVYEASAGLLKLCDPASVSSLKELNIGRADILCHEYIHHPAPNGSSSSHRRLELLAAGSTTGITLWSILNSAAVSESKRMVSRQPQTALQWAARYELLYSGSSVGEISAWDIHNNRVIPNVFNGRHDSMVTCLEFIATMDIIVSGSLDKSVRLWDAVGRCELKRFLAHRKGVVSLAYSKEFRFLLSGGLDHDICVWSPFADHLMFKLLGHTAPIVDCQFVSGTPQIVSADVDGVMKIWDARNFQCIQSIQTVANMSSFATCSARHCRILIASERELVHLDQEGGPYGKTIAQESISCCLFNSQATSLAAACGTTVKLWNALNGKLLNVYPNLAEHEITAMCLDSGERKLFVGDHAGGIGVFNYENGSFMKSLTRHEGEVSTLIYCWERHAVLSCGWDRRIRLHDETPIEEQVVLFDVGLSGAASAAGFGPDGLLVLPDKIAITALAISLSAGLVAAGDNLGRIHLWNVSRFGLEQVLQGSSSPINDLVFTGSLPMLVSCDDASNLTMWTTNRSRYFGFIVFEFQNTSILCNDVGAQLVSVISLCYDAAQDVLFTGDADGTVRSYSLKGVRLALPPTVETLSEPRSASARQRQPLQHAGEELPESDEQPAVQAHDKHVDHIRIVGKQLIPLVPFTVPLQSVFSVGDNVVREMFCIEECGSIVTTVFSNTAQVPNIWSRRGRWLGSLAPGSSNSKGKWRLRVNVEERQHSMETYTERLMSCLEQRQSGELMEEFDDFYPQLSEHQKRARQLPELEFPEEDRAKQLALKMRKNESVRLLADVLHDSGGEKKVQQPCSEANKPTTRTDEKSRPRTVPRQDDNAHMPRCVSAPSLSRRKSGCFRVRRRPDGPKMRELYRTVASLSKLSHSRTRSEIQRETASLLDAETQQLQRNQLMPSDVRSCSGDFFDAKVKRMLPRRRPSSRAAAKRLQRALDSFKKLRVSKT